MIRYVGYVAIGTGLWGITYYVYFLWTGRADARLPIGAFFAAMALALIAYLVAHRPVGVDVETWLVLLRFDQPVRGPLYSLILAGFALPPIVASVGYLSLLPKTPRREQRYRIALVSVSIILYLGSGLVVRLGTSDRLMFVNLTLFGLGTALAALWAYHPPSMLRAWLAREPDRARVAARVPQQGSFSQRCHELI